ncbi:hypothetical protein OG905_07090 [Streptomyces sp. NBC_00322]|uniref:hypothetical protein n=1 Tax=Streptomyces sp. NBC_00322 TaxID=2975712 RepID=UPI002E2CB9B1|nr:hypothetical protein [Streptomyces sp. NBC_00322]
MRLNATRTIAALATAVATSALVIPAASPATAATSSPAATSSSAEVVADSIDATCRSHSRTYIVRTYYRGPGKYTLRCGTSTWGWKHIKARHGWNSTMDRKISAAIWSGRPNGRGGYSTYTNTCPSIEKFRTIIGTPAGTNDLLTAYKVTTRAAAKC